MRLDSQRWSPGLRYLRRWKARTGLKNFPMIGFGFLVPQETSPKLLLNFSTLLRQRKNFLSRFWL